MFGLSHDHMADVTSRILQVLAIFCMCLMWFMIIDKGLSDLSVLVQEHPDDFWRALAKYLIGNMAEGADDVSWRQETEAEIF